MSSTENVAVNEEGEQPTDDKDQMRKTQQDMLRQEVIQE